MSDISASIEIRATPEDVFDIISDLPSRPDHLEAVTAIEVLGDGPIGPGTVFRETRRMLGKEATEEMTIGTLERPHRFVTTASSNGNDYLTTSSLEATDDGTRLRIAFDSTPSSLIGRLMAPVSVLFRGTIERALEQDLADLKRAIEARG